MDRAIVLVEICSALVGVSYGRHSPLVPVFAREPVAVDYSQVGLVGTVNYLPYMFAPFLRRHLVGYAQQVQCSLLWHFN
jgi:hypothetical protein